MSSLREQIEAALERADRVFHFDLRKMIEWGDHYNQAVKDAADSVRSVLSLIREGKEEPSEGEKTHARQPCSELAERICREPFTWNDGVPYCDACGLFRQSIAARKAREI